eukprot:TRINITY_DN1868_c3_g1_i1.p1 TRINITY_DN1868_c3_g1~~TRINITY_DN1868_c3_g1_i1.p1  ORF type:complete len:285 (+),score=30.03 TRINITY_DN1868_c3_g1_i1:45-899(+)
MPRGRWFIQDPRSCKWVQADDTVNNLMESAFKLQKSTIDITIGINEYRVDFVKRRMYGSSGGSRLIRRDEVQASNPYELDEYANPKLNMKEIENLYNKCKAASDTEEDLIQGEGLMTLCSELSISIDDVSLLLLACRIQAAEPFKIGRTEMIVALRSLGIDSVKKLKSAITQWKNELSNDRSFKYFYWFAFDWTREENSRVMQNEAAIESWKTLLSTRCGKFPLDLWCEFVSSQYKKAISKDAWKSLWDFMQTSAPDLSNYSEDEGWPVLMDEFVEWAQPKLRS